MIHHTKRENLNSILKKGLIPKVADEFKLLIPKADRDKPIVWLKEQCEFIERNCMDCDIFDSPSICLQIDLNQLDLNKLKRIKTTCKENKWWYYLGTILPKAISGHFKER